MSVSANTFVAMNEDGKSMQNNVNKRKLFNAERERELKQG
jgi:hypothetical protein